MCFSEVQRERLSAAAAGGRLGCSAGGGSGGPGRQQSPTFTLPRPPPPPPPMPPRACAQADLNSSSEGRPKDWGAGRNRNRMAGEGGEEKGEKACFTGVKASHGESPSASWVPVRGEGRRYFHFSGRANGGARGRGWQRLGKKEKENKLCSPLNIHDSSLAKANGKHINPFTTLLNAKKRWMRVTACSGANWEEYENRDHGRLGLQGGELAPSIQEVWTPVPFISHHYHQTPLSDTALLKVIFFFSS